MKSSDDCTEIMKNAPFVPKATCSNHIRLEKICAKPPARHRICSRMWISVNEGTRVFQKSKKCPDLSHHGHVAVSIGQDQPKKNSGV